MVVRWYGLNLTLYGMGLVFFLLAVLSVLTQLLVRLDKEPAAAADDEERDAPEAVATATVRGNTGALDPELLAAVVIACRAHRMTRRKQAAPEMRTHEPGSLPSRWVGAGRTRQNRSWAPGGRYA